VWPCPPLQLPYRRGILTSQFTCLLLHFICLGEQVFDLVEGLVEHIFVSFEFVAGLGDWTGGVSTSIHRRPTVEIVGSHSPSQTFLCIIRR